jgi:hypothetical protein
VGKEVAIAIEQVFSATMNGLENKTWYINSWMFQHLTFQKYVFSNYKIISKKSIYMGDNFVQKPIGMGSVHLNMRLGEHEVRHVLHEVLHVLGLVKNLFLVSKATIQGFKI